MRDIRDLQFGTRELALALAVLSAFAVLAALALQHLGGVRPCPLCYMERIAYYVSAPAGLAAFFLARRVPLAGRVLLGAVALAFAVNAGLGVYHAGIEWRWWPGPEECSGLGSIASSPQDLLKSLSQQGAVVRCDEAPLRILGISLAGYNALLSLGLTLVAAFGAAGGALSVRMWPPRVGVGRSASV